MNDHESRSAASGLPAVPGETASSHDARVARLLTSPHVTERRLPRQVEWPIAGHPEPADVAAFYRACDGLVLDDGTVLCGKGELHDLTQWVVLDRGLRWPDDFVVVGERSDAIVVLDLDVRGERAGGGVLEVVTDNLEALDRVASDLVSYAAMRARFSPEPQALLAPAAPPEVLGRQALSSGDADKLEGELARPFYPGSDRLVATLALGLGQLSAAMSDGERAMRAFERSVAARTQSVGVAARRAEGRAAWLAAARALRSLAATPGAPAAPRAASAASATAAPAAILELAEKCERRAAQADDGVAR